MPFYFLYLHGFNGSANGVGATELKQWLKRHYPDVHIDAPQLGHDSREALIQIHRLLDNNHQARKVIFGNSMGGVFAHIIKQTRKDIDLAILLNPGLRFTKIMSSFPRFHISNIDGGIVEITDDMINGIARLIPEKSMHQEDYLLLLQQDDHLCHYQDSLDILPNAKTDIQSGQGHHYNDITKAFPAIKQFLDNRLF